MLVPATRLEACRCEAKEANRLNFPFAAVLEAARDSGSAANALVTKGAKRGMVEAVPMRKEEKRKKNCRKGKKVEQFGAQIRQAKEGKFPPKVFSFLCFFDFPSVGCSRSRAVAVAAVPALAWGWGDWLCGKGGGGRGYEDRIEGGKEEGNM